MNYSADNMDMFDIVLAEGGHARVEISFGKDSDGFYGWIAQELQKYLKLLSGCEFPPANRGDIRSESVAILLGGPHNNSGIDALSRAKLVDFVQLKKDGFLIKSLVHDGRKYVVAGGNDEASTMYAVYELLERLGVVFQLTGDIIPESGSRLLLPSCDLVMQPELKYRGLHFRHFTQPWMGLDDFKKLLDQMAKMKCNYLEFFWYVGSPWIEYSYGGEKKLIGDINPRESGYLTWRLTAGTYTAKDVEIGRERFTCERVCAPEFQECNSQEETCHTARRFLKEIIAHAHKRRIQVWLGKGDCPSIPFNFGRFTKKRHTYYCCGVDASPSDPVGIEVWKSAVKAMIDTYPEADGYWLWLAEDAFHGDDPELEDRVSEYKDFFKLIPHPEELRKMGYTRAFECSEEEQQKTIKADMGLLYNGKQIADHIKSQYPAVRLGIALLGRSYLFPAMNVMFHEDMPFESMEASIVWNRKSRVPMEMFGTAGKRDTILIPRLDDDTSEFGMQFNVNLYCHDRVLEGSAQNNVSGVAPQVGKLRGMEQNAAFICRGAWKTSMKPDEFYSDYVKRIFGENAFEQLFKAYKILERQEMYLGLEADTSRLGNTFYLGMRNFSNWGVALDTTQYMSYFHNLLKNPFDGPDSPEWSMYSTEKPGWLKTGIYRRERFGEGIGMLKEALECLYSARGKVLPGSEHELDYLIFKTGTYIKHLEAIRALLGCYISYDDAFRAKGKGNYKEMQDRLNECGVFMAEAEKLSTETALEMAEKSDHGGETYILFRYNFLFVKPIREFARFMTNVVNFHRGLEYWKEVNWDIICSTCCRNPYSLPYRNA